MNENQTKAENPVNNDLFKGLGVAVDIKVRDNFLKIAETLTRVGISSKNENKLYPSCVILHKKNKDGISEYRIMHFKEMFALDGKTAEYDTQDIPRRNAIVRLLEEWNLLDILKPELVQDVAPVSTIKILSHKEKKDWTIIQKYQVGKNKKDIKK